MEEEEEVDDDESFSVLCFVCAPSICFCDASLTFSSTFSAVFSFSSLFSFLFSSFN